MASSSSAKGGGTRWGSLLSQAVAGVEARLDTILSEADDAAKQQEQKPPAKPPAASPAKTSASCLTLPPYAVISPPTIDC